MQLSHVLKKSFEAGVKSVDPSIKIKVDYAGSFCHDAAKGKTNCSCSLRVAVHCSSEAAHEKR